MTRIALILIAGVAIGIGGLMLARPEENGEHVKDLASYDLSAYKGS